MFELGEDKKDYRCLTDRYVRKEVLQGQSYLVVEGEALELLAREAFADVSFFFRTHHLEGWRAILEDPQASENDKFVAAVLLRNAVISSECLLPSCQDTGTATVVAFKGHRVLTDGKDPKHLEEGIARTWRDLNLRYSQLAPLDMYKEINTGTNLPAQIDIYSKEGESYDFLFIAKGGGSANKTLFFQATKAILEPGVLENYLTEKIALLGTAGCPPYHLAVVIGGTSPEWNLKVVKLATAGYLDGLPGEGSREGRAFRDRALEKRLLERSRSLPFGAQYGGRYFAMSVRVIRLPRHAASLPVGIGVSCSADRNILGRITERGVFLERLDKNPERFAADLETFPEAVGVPLDTGKSMEEVRAVLGKHPVGTLVKITGPLIVARDAAHARIRKLLHEGKPLPEYFKRYPIYYAGPAKTPQGMPSGSFGPTTSQRMDKYAVEFMEHGGSLVTLGKGNRGEELVQACKRWGGFYLGTIGGAAALVAKEHVRSQEVVDFEDLGMEAVRRLEVQGLPAFIVIDDKGNDLYKR